VPRLLPDAHLTRLDHGDWLIPSRYCPSDRLAPTAEALFPERDDPLLLERCREWVETNLTYVSGSSDAMTSADETLMSREGICRDFAHLLIALLRGLGVPARFVAVYGPGVDPPDFHAVVEAHDGERWQLFDPTGMTSPAELVVIARGRDAGDVPWCQIQGGQAEVTPPLVSAAVAHRPS
jgi:transglutaminase-like putative cysteine protease